MSQIKYFTPGPTHMYPGVSEFLAEALDKDVFSISHRSQAYKDVHENTVNQLRTLINLPDDFHVFFLGSASEAWERIFLNLVGSSSFHFVNGAFSKKFFQYGEALKKQVNKIDAPMGEGFDLDNISIPDVEMIAVTQNETSSGVYFPLQDIYEIRKAHQEAILAIDMVSIVPYPDLDFNQIDTGLFSVQKCFGLPAGLGVWLVNDRCIEKAKSLASSGNSLGAHHGIPELYKKGVAHQTPSTPNVLGIYLLGKVCEAMNAKGIDTIREETDTKAEMLYNAISEINYLDFGVTKEAHRSNTVIVANSEKTASEINESLKSQNMVIGSGYGDKKASQIRIANFPAFSVEDVGLLIEGLKKV